MTEPDAPATGRDALLAALLALATLIAYAPALGGGFVWDDDAHVTQNPRLDSVDGLVQIWTDPRAIPLRQNYPLTFTTFWLETRLYGVDPFGYHLVNVLLHIGSALLLWRSLRRWGIPGAFLAAGIFALHPIEVESVAWISERKNTLSTFLYLLAFACFPFEAPNKFGTRRWLGSLALFGLAVSAKTVTATLPGALLVAQWYRNGRLRLADAVGTAPFFVLGLGMALPTRDIERSYVGATGPDWDFSWVERFEIASRAWWFYLGKVVWPFHNSFVYERFAIDGASVVGMGLLAAAAALGVLLFALRDRIGRGPFATLAIFSGSLLPALGFFDVFPFRYSFVADHFAYLGSLGAITLVAAGLASASAGWPTRARAAAATALLAGLGVLSSQHSRAFESDETLWQATLVEQPEHWFAHNNLGAIYLDTGRIAQARPHFEAAAAGRPHSVGIVENLARVSVALGDWPSARNYTEEWIALSPSDARAVFGLVAACMALQDAACVSTEVTTLRELIPQLRAANDPFWLRELDPLCERVASLGRAAGMPTLVDLPGCSAR